MMPAAAGVGLVVMGVMLARCSPVMINWTVGRASLEHVMNCTGIKTVITSKAFLKKLGPEVELACLLEADGMVIFTEDLKENRLGGFGLFQKLSAKRAAGKSADTLVQRYKLSTITREDEAVVLFTSGSESVPKGVPLTHGNILSNVAGMLNVAQVDDGDCLFGALPPFHSFGFTVTTMAPLVSGLKIAYYPNPTEYRRISREVQRWKPTIYLGTPTFVNGVLQASKVDVQKAEVKIVPGNSAKVFPLEASWPTASLRLCVTGAEKTPDELFALAAEHVPTIEIIEGYGITETSPVLTANRLGKPRAGVGLPIPGASLALLEEAAYLEKRQEVLCRWVDGRIEGPAGVRGVILAGGPSVFGAPDADPPSGYLKIPLSEKNPFIKVEGTWMYDTGDLGYFDEGGNLYLAGRLKRFVKIAGEMVSLVALEAALKQRTLEDGSRPWADSEAGPRVAAECFEPDGGGKPILGLVAAVDATLEDANEQLRAAGMPKIAKLTVHVDARVAFGARWAEQGTLPLLGTGKTDYASCKRAVAEVAKGPEPDAE